MMQEDGINDVRMACIIQDIRSKTLNEEFYRIKRLLETNPPIHDGWPVAHKILCEECPKWLKGNFDG
jgi:hypothetical protein